MNELMTYFLLGLLVAIIAIILAMYFLYRLGYLAEFGVAPQLRPALSTSISRAEMNTIIWCGGGGVDSITEAGSRYCFFTIATAAGAGIAIAGLAFEPTGQSRDAPTLQGTGTLVLSIS